jgi:Metallo-peptidase family M12
MRKEINRRQFFHYLTLTTAIGLSGAAADVTYGGHVDPKLQPVEAKPELTNPPALYTKIEKTDLNSPTLEQTTYAQINPDALAQKRFTVEGLSGEPVTVTINYLDYQLGHIILVGETDKKYNAVLSIDLESKTVSGRIEVENQKFLTISPKSSLNSKILYISDTAPRIVDKVLEVDPKELRHDLNTLHNKQQYTQTDTIVDMYVAYTPSAANYYNATQTDMEHIIAQQIAVTNSAYYVSKSSVRNRLVGVEIANYLETADDQDAVTHFFYDNDGLMDENIAHARALGADVRMLIDRPTDAQLEFCGAAFVLQSSGLNNRLYANHAMAVVHAQCTDGTFQHERGHVDGQNHDIFVSPPPNSSMIAPFAFGWVGRNIRDIMSYTDANPNARRVLHYSNPRVIKDGEATGIENVADNVRAIELSKLTVANYEPSVIPFPELTLNHANMPFVIKGPNTHASLSGTYNVSSQIKTLYASINYGPIMDLGFQGGFFNLEFDATNINTAVISVFADGYNGIVKSIEIVHADKQISGTIKDQFGKPVIGTIIVKNQEGLETDRIYVNNQVGYFSAWASGASNILFVPDINANPGNRCTTAGISINPDSESVANILVNCTREYKQRLPFVVR